MNRWQHSCGAWLVVTGLVLALTACAGVPAQEMSDARQAIRAARAAGAQKAAPATLADAQDRLEVAEEALRQRDFREARRAAEQAGARARSLGRRELSANGGYSFGTGAIAGPLAAAIISCGAFLAPLRG